MGAIRRARRGLSPRISLLLVLVSFGFLLKWLKETDFCSDHCFLGCGDWIGASLSSRIAIQARFTDERRQLILHASVAADLDIRDLSNLQAAWRHDACTSSLAHVLLHEY